MFSTAFGPRAYPTPSRARRGTGLSLNAPTQGERQYARALTAKYTKLRRGNEARNGQGKWVQQSPCAPANSSARRPGLRERIKSLSNLRRGGDGDRKGKGKWKVKHPRGDIQVADEIPPVPDIPAEWRSPNANPEQMMTLEEFLNC